MTDIARLGFSVDTGDLTRASASLKAIVAPAREAANAADSVSASFNKVDAAAGKVTPKVDSAAQGAGRAATLWERLVGWLNKGAASADAAAAATTRMGTAAQQAVPKIARLGQAANDNLNAVQATPANIAAQFQDIGVTAAMGMNPMMIALQQGTQLSVAFSNGIGGIGAALRQILSPTALLTIAAVGLVAALIQMVDWTQVAKDALYGIADALEVAAPYAAAFGAAMLLIYSPAIISGIAAITVGLWNMAAAMLAAIGLPVLLVAGFLAIVAAANYFRDDLTQILGFDIVKVAKDGVNYIIGTFVGGYNAIKATWSQLPAAIGDLAIQAVNYVIKAVEDMINGSIVRINALLAMLPFGVGEGLSMGSVSFGGLDNPYAGAAKNVADVASKAVKAGQDFDYVGGAIKGIGNVASWAAGKLRGLADGLGKGDDHKKKDGASKGSHGKTDAEKFGDILGDADRKLAQLKAEHDMIGLYGEALYKARFEQEMMNKAAQQGLKLGPAQIAQIKEKAEALGKQQATNEHDQFIENLIQDADAQTIAFKRQREEMGLSGAALTAYKWETEKLALAQRQHITLTDEEIATLHESSIAYGETAEAIKQQREALDFARATYKGFFTDAFSNIRKGESLWKSFGDAALNAVNRLIDRLLDGTLDQAFNKLFHINDGGSGGGFLGSLGRVLGLGSKAIGGDTANLEKNFDSVFSKHAKGDVFGGPRMFSYGGGTKLGQMGEAGPEAAMPLTRLPNGDLGVQSVGGGRQAPQPVQIVVSPSQYFDATVDQRSANVAVPIAVQSTVTGNQVSQQKMSRRARQRIPT